MLILLQTAPIGFNNAGWKYYLVIILWSAAFIPVIYLHFPETARLTLEEIAKNFGEEVAVHVTDAPDAEKARLKNNLGGRSDVSQPSEGSEMSRCTEGAATTATTVELYPKDGQRQPLGGIQEYRP